MKIVTLANVQPRKRGGFEQEMQLLSRELAEGGHQHTAFFSGPPAPWLQEGLESAGTVVRDLSLSRPADTWKLARAVRREKADLAHLHYFRVFGALAPALKLAGVPRVVVSERMGLRVMRRSFFRGLAARLRARLAQPCIDRVVCVSDYVKNRLIVSDFAKPQGLERIYNGVDLEPRGGTEEQARGRSQLHLGPATPLVCAAAYAAPGKGVEVFVEAAKRTLAAREDTVFLHLGDGPLLEDLRRQAAAAGLGEKFRFLGHQTEVRPWMADAAVVVIPSTEPEGLSYAALEAAAEGRPVVATTAGGLPEVVVDGETGILVEPGNVGAMAQAITRLLEDPELARRFGKAGRERAEKLFDLRRKVQDTLALYERIVHG